MSASFKGTRRPSAIAVAPGLNFDPFRRPEAAFRAARVLNLFFRPSKRKTPCGAHLRTRPSNPSFTDCKSPKLPNLPTAYRGRRRRPHRSPRFRAADPIWDGNRGKSRGKPSNPHTFLCSACFGATRCTRFAGPVSRPSALGVPRGRRAPGSASSSWPGKSAKRVFHTMTRTSMPRRDPGSRPGSWLRQPAVT